MEDYTELKNVLREAKSNDTRVNVHAGDSTTSGVVDLVGDWAVTIGCVAIPADQRVVTYNQITGIHTVEGFEEIFKTPTSETSEDQLVDIAVKMHERLTVTDLLGERGTRYGKFPTHAQITQDLKGVMTNTPNWTGLEPDQKEALEMVAHKIGRILNGDPDYDDSWVDIAGYVTLISNRLQESDDD